GAGGGRSADGGQRVSGYRRGPREYPAEPLNQGVIRLTRKRVSTSVIPARSVRGSPVLHCCTRASSAPKYPVTAASNPPGGTKSGPSARRIWSSKNAIHSSRCSSL